jgi:GT2 family glycosyltransferase
LVNETTKNLPLVSIIIVNYNGKSYLEKCLKSLIEINYKNTEIILVDNNSSDSSIKFVEDNYPSIIILKLDQNFGFAKPNNMAAKIAKGEYLLFLNNDTMVTPNFISELLKTFALNSNIAICQSYLLKMNGDVDSSGDFIDFLGRAFSSKEKNPVSQKDNSDLFSRKLFNFYKLSI